MASLRSTRDRSEGLSVHSEDPPGRLDRVGGTGPGQRPRAGQGARSTLQSSMLE